MAFKKLHTVVAVVGIVGASTLAWWLQSPKSEAGGPSGARPLGVEVGQVSRLRAVLGQVLSHKFNRDLMNMTLEGWKWAAKRYWDRVKRVELTQRLHLAR